ncbi:MAG TPA: hypothetical protein VFA18_23480 [Gemmataceae bacterium]|nr:hypothetical protein [Gemmataceae bacterium]
MVNIFQLTQKEASLRLSWQNRHSPNWIHLGCSLTFWVIWAPLTIFVTWLLVRGIGPTVFLAVWLVFGWLGTLALPYSVLGLLCGSEWLEMTPTAVTVGRRGLLARRTKTYPLTLGLTLYLGWWRTNQQIEAFPTLNLFWQSRAGMLTRRAVIGGWLRREALQEICQTVAAFVHAHNLPLATRCDPQLARPPSVAPKY